MTNYEILNKLEAIKDKAYIEYSKVNREFLEYMKSLEVCCYCVSIKGVTFFFRESEREMLSWFLTYSLEYERFTVCKKSISPDKLEDEIRTRQRYSSVDDRYLQYLDSLRGECYDF